MMKICFKKLNKSTSVVFISELNIVTPNGVVYQSYDSIWTMGNNNILIL